MQLQLFCTRRPHVSEHSSLFSPRMSLSSPSAATKTQSVKLLFSACDAGEVDKIRELLFNGVNVNTRRNGETCLYHACSLGYYDVVLALLECPNILINKTHSGNSETPLYVSAEKGYAVIVELLLDKGANINMGKEKDGSTPLCIAAQCGFMEVVKLLVERGADINLTRASIGDSPIFRASEHGFLDIVEYLIEKGADVEKATTARGATPVIVAAETGQFEVVRSLVLKGHANMHHLTIPDCATALFFACQTGRENILRFFLENGCQEEVNKVTTTSNATALVVASEKGHPGVVKMLLEANADVNNTLKNGSSSLSLATEYGHLPVVTLLLQGKGINVNTVRSSDKFTPLHLACFYSGHFEIAEAIVNSGLADVNAVSIHKETPLHITAAKGTATLVKLLLEHGASVDAVDEHGQTPLFLACKNGCIDCVNILIRHGANIFLKDGAGKQPLDYPFPTTWAEERIRFYFSSVPAVAFLLGHNPRCGAQSSLQILPSFVLADIAKWSML